MSPNVEMSPNVRELLDHIDNFLVNASPADFHAAWDILTALRGPDSRNLRLKETTTVPIRRAAFPRMAAEGDIVNWEFNTNNFHGVIIGPSTTFSPQESTSHFGSHALRAALSLGIYNK